MHSWCHLGNVKGEEQWTRGAQLRGAASAVNSVSVGVSEAVSERENERVGEGARPIEKEGQLRLKGKPHERGERAWGQESHITCN
jgi:hypothetical protein